MKDLQKKARDFLKERDWEQYHQPKDLLLGIVEEIGEFRNLVKWEQDPKKILKIIKDNHEEAEDFFGDVLWYLSSLANVCNVDLKGALDKVIKENEKRFPRHLVKGNVANPKTGGVDLKYKKKG